MHYNYPEAGQSTTYSGNYTIPLTYPNLMTTGYCLTYPSFNPEIEIKKVANGLIAKKAGLEYVFINEKALCEWLTKELKGSK